MGLRPSTLPTWVFYKVETRRKKQSSLGLSLESLRRFHGSPVDPRTPLIYCIVMASGCLTRFSAAIRNPQQLKPPAIQRTPVSSKVLDQLLKATT